MKKNCINKY